MTPKNEKLDKVTCSVYDIANLAEMLREDSVHVDDEGYDSFSNVQRTSMANAIESLAMGAC